VLSAIRVLQQEYIRKVNLVPLLNAAIAALRTRTGLGADKLPDIPTDAAENAAIEIFKKEFKAAVQAANAPES